MFSNTLTRDIGLKVGPVMLGTLVNHYFDRRVNATESDPEKLSRQPDGILYDEAFNIIKAFLHESTFHTVEELQQLSNTRMPSSPRTLVVRELVPMLSCDQAATYLIKALGGEDKAREIVGGVKWWQVRGVEGVNCQWIATKKDWREAQRRRKTRESQRKTGSLPRQPNSPQSPLQPAEHDQRPAEHGDDAENGTYEEYMDEMRCILYIHGGGYYFGSVDQQRYSIHRHARKINGRVFAVDYRLAPQYPFPCALQDALAAYLYLIRPPPGADHSPIDPAHIVIAGDSAGGGLSLALLQVIRDTGLPPPAGGILISPWCDLTHSFPSIHTNTKTDVIPPSGLSFHKPSTLWPPPSHHISSHVHASLRQKLRRTLRIDENPGKATDPAPRVSLEVQTETSLEVREKTTTPTNAVDPQKLLLVTKAGENLEIDQQVHFYAQNSLVVHPLVSPALSYLGGLPPLLFIAGDQEVLRDEIIYAAHKAAYPQRFPIKDEVKALYSQLHGIEERHPKPTPVHLQVYDGTCHDLPVLFLFSTPAKYCFRSMATFVKFATGMALTPPISPSDSSIRTTDHTASNPEIKRATSSDLIEGKVPTTPAQEQIRSMSTPANLNPSESSTISAPTTSRRQSLLSRASSILYRRSNTTIREGINKGGADTIGEGSATSRDAGGPWFQRMNSGKFFPSLERLAGDPAVYENIKDRKAFDMIRERVSTNGVVRPLEPEAELGAFSISEELIGVLSERVVMRFVDNDTHFRQKFAHTYKAVEKIRKKHLDRIAKEESRQESRRFKVQRENKGANGSAGSDGHDLKSREKILNSPGWGYSWALDELERPPPSSIAARRDTEEARKLAKIADQAIMGDANTFNANALWSVVMNFLTDTQDRPSRWTGELENPPMASEGRGTSGGRTEENAFQRFSQLFRRQRVEEAS